MAGVGLGVSFGGRFNAIQKKKKKNKKKVNVKKT